MLIAGYTLTFIDEYVDSLLTEERVCDIIMPRLIKRQVLEENNDIGPRKSRLLDALEGKSDDGRSDKSRSRSRRRSRNRNRSRNKSRDSGGSNRYMSRSRSRSRSRSGSVASFRSRSRSISPDRMEIEQ